MYLTLGFSVPIRNYTKNVIASLTGTIPGDHFSEEKKTHIIKRLQSTAQEISRKLGCTSTIQND